MGKLYTANDVRGAGVRWSSYSSPIPSDDPDDFNAPAPKTGKGKRVIPRAVIREINMKVSANEPTGYCDYCKHYFRQSYVRPITDRFKTLNACADCRHARNLH